ncbi:MAG: His/Gly/Thr/Pro-type tRNA ligase C-terminal domain-containing protein [Candidatus Pacebacteria bacterium]|nr:His/Gly/Thr/Pro-type tRNA ligase C-terminal domain-containing protein [Candidatus Paceibacterota bacterium]
MMREIIPAEELLHKARAVGQYYGFTPLITLTAKKRGAERATGIPESLTGLALDPVAETIASFLRQYRNTERASAPRTPLFLWHTNITPGRPAQKRATVQFHAIGTDRALADAVIIRALIALTRDLYHEEPVVRINSMGDKETRARYARELANYFKKRANALPEECVERAKCDALAAAELVIATECADDLPAPTEHLSDASRKRFEDLLDYLEMTETPYELAKNLISRGNIWNDTCFEVIVGGRRVAWGSRYNDLAKHFFPSSPFSATGAVLQIASEGMATIKAKPARLRYSFVHIGDEAKRLSIKLAEDFRKAHIPLTQDIGIESLTEQLNLAERRESPYLLIMGRKEALEGSAILRNRATQEETILPLTGLAERLKSFA